MNLLGSMLRSTAFKHFDFAQEMSLGSWEVAKGPKVWQLVSGMAMDMVELVVVGWWLVGGWGLVVPAIVFLLN